MEFQDFSEDQRRELINTRQRYAVWRDLSARARETKGSMVWITSKGSEYLARSYYEKEGLRRQTSLGPRTPETENIKRDFALGRQTARENLAQIETRMTTQAAINRALGLGRVPVTGARIIRAIDTANMLGAGLRIVGTSAIYAYEAAAGLFVDPGLTATTDIDLLFVSRQAVHFVVDEDVTEQSLIKILKKIDRSFDTTPNVYRAQNADGYMLDLIKPVRNPPWAPDRHTLGRRQENDLTAAEIEGLVWLENAPPFEAVGIDERGFPLRMVAPDPRAWAIHKHWLSTRLDRDPVKKRRDAEQAKAVAEIVTRYLPHLPFEMESLRMLPRQIVEEAAPLFGG